MYSQTDKPYIILYCYELLNKIGVMSSADAYNRLSAVLEGCRGFCPALDTVLPRWLKDFRAYNAIGGVAACPAESALDTRPPDDLDILECRYSGKLEYLMGISSYNLRGSIFLTDETRPLMEGALESALTALDGYFKKSGVTKFELLCGKLPYRTVHHQARGAMPRDLRAVALPQFRRVDTEKRRIRAPEAHRLPIRNFAKYHPGAERFPEP